jgi:hypothetical protein
MASSASRYPHYEQARLQRVAEKNLVTTLLQDGLLYEICSATVYATPLGDRITVARVGVPCKLVAVACICSDSSRSYRHLTPQQPHEHRRWER